MILEIAFRKASLGATSFSKTESGRSGGAFFLFFALALALTGCGREGIRVYRVAKEEKPKAVAAPLPANWESAPLGEMRAASFRISGDGDARAEVSVIPLPGQAGRDVDNVNRWRGQVGLPAASDSEVGKLAEPVEIAGQAAELYEMTGENPGSGDRTSILAAILRKEGSAWFFKMSGDSGLVGQQKAAFVSYLKTFQFPSESGAGQSAPKEAELPPGHPPLSLAAQSSTAPAQTSGRPTWKVPSGWREVDGGQFLVAKFVIPGATNSHAIVNVSMAAGNGGGLAANVNRWRKQVGLSELSESAVSDAVKQVNVGEVKASLVELTGADSQSGNATRMLALVVPDKSQTWFYKLTGATPLVDLEKEAFINFVQTAKYTE